MPDDEDVSQLEEEQTPASRPFWSGTITFGLVSIPVSLFPANRGGGVRLRMLSPDGVPLSRRYYSESTGRDLAPEEMTRGYELDDGRYVEVTDEELDRLAPEKSRDIDLRRFVPRDAISPRFFDRGYFLSPAGGSNKAYRLLAQTMDETGRAGIATFVMRGKEYLVAILSDHGLLRAETLRFFDEIRTPETVGLPDRSSPPAKAVQAFEKTIDRGSRDEIAANEFRDRDAERLMRLVESKRKKPGNVVGKAEAGDDDMARPVPDLLEALRRSLGAAGGKTEKAASHGRAEGGSKGSGKADDLEKLSRTELYERAKKLRVEGRSAMSKSDLIEAIRRAA